MSEKTSKDKIFVLIVCKYPNVINSTKRYLENRGYAVLVETDPSKALHKACRGEVEYIFVSTSVKSFHQKARALETKLSKKIILIEEESNRETRLEMLKSKISLKIKGNFSSRQAYLFLENFELKQGVTEENESENIRTDIISRNNKNKMILKNKIKQQSNIHTIKGISSKRHMMFQLKKRGPKVNEQKDSTENKSTSMQQKWKEQRHKNLENTQIKDYEASKNKRNYTANKQMSLAKGIAREDTYGAKNSLRNNKNLLKENLPPSKANNTNYSSENKSEDQNSRNKSENININKSYENNKNGKQTSVEQPLEKKNKSGSLSTNSFAKNSNNQQESNDEAHQLSNESLTERGRGKNKRKEISNKNRANMQESNSSFNRNERDNKLKTDYEKAQKKKSNENNERTVADAKDEAKQREQNSLSRKEQRNIEQQQTAENKTKKSEDPEDKDRKNYQPEYFSKQRAKENEKAKREKEKQAKANEAIQGHALKSKGKSDQKNSKELDKKTPRKPDLDLHDKKRESFPKNDLKKEIKNLKRRGSTQTQESLVKDLIEVLHKHNCHSQDGPISNFLFLHNESYICITLKSYKPIEFNSVKSDMKGKNHELLSYKVLDYSFSDLDGEIGKVIYNKEVHPYISSTSLGKDFEIKDFKEKVGFKFVDLEGIDSTQIPIYIFFEINSRFYKIMNEGSFVDLKRLQRLGHKTIYINKEDLGKIKEQVFLARALKNLNFKKKAS